MKKTTTTHNDYLIYEPYKPQQIEAIKMVEITKIPEFYEEIFDRKLMYDCKLKYIKLMNNVINKDDAHYLKPLSLSPIPKLPKVFKIKNKDNSNWFITIVLSSMITAILSIHF